MNRVLILLAAAALLAAPSWAGGSIGLFVTHWDTDEADSDLGGGALAEIRLGSNIDVEVRGSIYSSFVTLVGGQLAEFSASAIDGGIAYNFLPQGKANPYLGGGLTFVLPDLDDDSLGRMRDENGWYALAGIEFPVGRRLKLFVEGIYRNVKATSRGDDLGFEVVDEKVDMAGGVVNGGLAFSW